MSLMCLIIFASASLLALLDSSVRAPETHSFVGINKTLKIGRKDLFPLLVIFSLSFLCATRDDASPDTFAYIDWYQRVCDLSVSQIDGEYGILFEFVSRLVGLVFGGENYSFYFFFLTFFNNLVLYVAMKRLGGNYVARYILYAFLIGIYYNFAVLRQGLAFTFLICAMSLWRYPNKRFTLLLLAPLAHNTAIVPVLYLIFVRCFSVGRRVLLFVCLAAVINYIFRFSDPYIVPLMNYFTGLIPAAVMPRYELYFLNGETGAGFSYFYLIYFILIAIMCFCFSQNEIRGEAAEDLSTKELLNVGVMGLVILSFCATFTISVRFSDYFILPAIVLLLPQIRCKTIDPVRVPCMIGLCIVGLWLYCKMFLTKVPLFLL